MAKRKPNMLPSGNARVQGQVTIDGKVIRKSFTADTRAEAEYLREQWKRQTESDATPTNWTLEQACHAYIELKRPYLSPTTMNAEKGK